MIEQVHQLLRSIKSGTMSSLAYDTAWVARLGEIDWDLSSRALEWLCTNQLSDGSWGADQPFYYHDRVISTLAATIALSQRGRRAMDKKFIERGIIALERITNGATQGLQADLNGATVGFEMIVPTLVAEAEKLGLIKQQGDSILGRLAKMRAEKMGRLKGRRINKYMTAAFSAEMAGKDGIEKLLDVESLQESNGSVGHSPSASAYYATFIHPSDSNSLEYLHTTITSEGGMCNLYPFDIYERAWVLWNLSWVQHWDQITLDLIKPHLDYLYKSWRPGKGVGFSAGYSIPDGDDTIISFDILDQYKQEVDIDSVLAFEKDDHFSCYDLEVGISPSVNIHALMTLFRKGYELSHPRIQKILHFLQKNHSHPYWIDKWHSSPFYTSAHFIMACAGYFPELAKRSVDWIVSVQNCDGSWGFIAPTAEETSYCLQALSIWERETTNHSVRNAISKGKPWLEDHADGPYPPLWIGKGLYSAELVVRSSILSALFLSKQ